MFSHIKDAIAGFGGIVANALYTQHKNFMTEFCPPVAPYTPDTQTEETCDISDEEIAHYIDPLTYGEESIPDELISDVVRSLVEEANTENAITDP